MRGVALLAAALVAPQNRTLTWLVLFQELSALTRAIADMHQAARDAHTAAQLRDTLEQRLQPVGQRLVEQRAEEDPEFAQALEAQRLAAVARPPASTRDTSRGPRPAAPSPSATPARPRRPEDRRRGQGPSR